MGSTAGLGDRLRVRRGKDHSESLKVSDKILPGAGCHKGREGKGRTGALAGIGRITLLLLFLGLTTPCYGIPLTQIWKDIAGEGSYQKDPFTPKDGGNWETFQYVPPHPLSTFQYVPPHPLSTYIDGVFRTISNGKPTCIPVIFQVHDIPFSWHRTFDDNGNLQVESDEWLLHVMGKQPDITHAELKAAQEDPNAKIEHSPVQDRWMFEFVSADADKNGRLSFKVRHDM